MASHHNEPRDGPLARSSALCRSRGGETRSPGASESLPLIAADGGRPPLAKFETDDEPDDREVVTAAYPGVDDGFFAEGERPDYPDSDEAPKPDDDIPVIISPRAGGDGDSENPDEVDGARKPDHPLFPGAPGFGYDIEAGNAIPDSDSIPDVNIYQHKKTLAQGMMDLALFSANANQLRYVLETFNRHPYYWPSLILISFSLMFQVAVGIGLIWNATYNVKNDKEICIANRINNFTVIGIFLITVINVFISAFGVANAG